MSFLCSHKRKPKPIRVNVAVSAKKALKKNAISPIVETEWQMVISPGAVQGSSLKTTKIRDNHPLNAISATIKIYFL